MGLSHPLLRSNSGLGLQQNHQTGGPVHPDSSILFIYFFSKGPCNMSDSWYNFFNRKWLEFNMFGIWMAEIQWWTSLSTLDWFSCPLCDDWIHKLTQTKAETDRVRKKDQTDSVPRHFPMLKLVTLNPLCSCVFYFVHFHLLDDDLC